MKRESCPICLCEFEDGDLLRILYSKHYYHKLCIDQWLILITLPTL